LEAAEFWRELVAIADEHIDNVRYDLRDKVSLNGEIDRKDWGRSDGLPAPGRNLGHRFGPIRFKVAGFFDGDQRVGRVTASESKETGTTF
jgi:hypothetical protein